MLKRIMGVFMMLIAISLIAGCGIKTRATTTGEKVHSKMLSIKNYEAEAIISFTKSGETRTIKMRQNYVIDKGYTIALIEPERLKGYTVTCYGDKVAEYNPITGKTLERKASAMQNELLFGSFIDHYKHAEGIQSKEDKLEGKEVITLETTIPGNYKYMFKEKVWLDAESLVPIQMHIYSQEEEKIIDIKFVTFKINQN